VKNYTQDQRNNSHTTRWGTITSSPHKCQLYKHNQCLNQAIFGTWDAHIH